MYFLSFWIIVIILFTNLLFGVIVSGYESIEVVARAVEGTSKVPVSVIVRALKEGVHSKQRLVVENTPEGIRICRADLDVEEEEEEVE
jgi:hypothetical protein